MKAIKKNVELSQIRSHAYSVLSGMQFYTKVTEADKKKLSKLMSEIDKLFLSSLDDLISEVENKESCCELKAKEAKSQKDLKAKEAKSQTDEIVKQLDLFKKDLPALEVQPIVEVKSLEELEANANPSPKKKPGGFKRIS